LQITDNLCFDRPALLKHVPEVQNRREMVDALGDIGDPAAREPVLVQDFNNRPGETFKVYYSLDAPPQTAPCHESRPDIGGWVCR
jgi:hypothetical protein